MTLCRIALFLVSALVHPSSARLGQSRQPFLVKLWKEHARSNKSDVNATKEKVVDHGGGYFVGSLLLGSPTPQELHVVFSTTTGMVSLPSSNCSSVACREHSRYSACKSQSSMDVQRDGSPVDPNGGRVAPEGAKRDTASLGFWTTGSGKDDSTGLEGNFVQERLCVGDRLGNAGKREPACAKVVMVVATTMQEATFATRPQDGLVGLGLEALSIQPQFNILNQLGVEGLQKTFGFFVEDDAKNAEIVFGGFDRERLASPLAWVPVATPELGHWLVEITGVRVGSQLLNMCQGTQRCLGLVDTGSPGITMPEGLAPELDELIKPKQEGGKGCALPELTLELSGGVSLTLRVEDYAGPRCEPEIRTHHFGEFIVGAQLFLLGEPVLRRYYTVFDWGEERVGFGVANVERSCQRLHVAGLPTGPGDCQGEVGPLEDELFMLEQEQGVTLRRNKQET